MELRRFVAVFGQKRSDELAVPVRRQAGLSLVQPAEMRLIGETGREGNLDDLLVTVGQTARGVRHPLSDAPLRRRDAHGSAKSPGIGDGMHVSRVRSRPRRSPRHRDGVLCTTRRFRRETGVHAPEDRVSQNVGCLEGGRVLRTQMFEQQRCAGAGAQESALPNIYPTAHELTHRLPFKAEVEGHCPNRPGASFVFRPFRFDDQR